MFEQLMKEMEATNKSFEKLQETRESVMSPIAQRHNDLQEALNSLNRTVNGFSVSVEKCTSALKPVEESEVSKQLDSIGADLDALLADL